MIPNRGISPFLDVTLPPYCAKADGSDDTGAFAVAIADACGAGGGIIFVPAGTYRIDGQLAIPNDGAAVPRQPSIRFIGTGMSCDSALGEGPCGGSQLDMSHAGAVAKLDTRGRGFLSFEGMTFKDAGGGATPFIQSTNTTLRIRDCAFYGDPAKTGQQCDQDAIVLGGGDLPIDGSATARFQGYGTLIEGCYFDRIRRAVWFRRGANGIQCVNNTVWKNCGSALAHGAPFEFLGIDGQGSVSGTYLAGNLIEARWYPHSFKLEHAVKNNFIANSIFDMSGSTVPQSVAYFGAGASRNHVITGFDDDSVPDYSEDVSVAGTNTVQTSHQSQVSRLTEPHEFTNTSSALKIKRLTAGSVTGPTLEDAAGNRIYFQLSGGNTFKILYAPASGGAPQLIFVASGVN